MAISSGIFSSVFFSPDTTSLLKRPLPPSSSYPPLLFPSVAPAPPPANLRMVRTVTAFATSTGSPQPRGIMKPRPVSPEMADFVGASIIPRTEALKRIWAYIKEHNLQDPNNKRIIVCDEKLKKIFAGKDRVGFLEIAGLISPHFLK